MLPGNIFVAFFGSPDPWRGKQKTECLKFGQSIEFLALAPDGEPALDLNSYELLKELKRFGIPRAVISIAAHIDRQTVHEAHSQAERASIRVDAVDEPDWRRIKRPHRHLFLAKILTASCYYDQTLAERIPPKRCRFPAFNHRETAIDNPLNHLLELQPQKSYPAIPTRPPAESWVKFPGADSRKDIFRISAQKIKFMNLLFETERIDFISTGDLVKNILSITAGHSIRQEASRSKIDPSSADWSVVEKHVESKKITLVQCQEDRFFIQSLQRNQSRTPQPIMITEIHPLLNILLLSLIASLGTGLGGLIAIIRKPGRRSYGLLMGITAGVMISLSFLELVNQAWELAGPLTATIGFGIGASFMFLLDHFSPHIRFGEKEIRGLPGSVLSPMHGFLYPGRRRFGRWRNPNQITDRKLVNTGLLLAAGITLHNLPEGIAVGAGYLHNPQFGIFVALAIMIHNIPEGIATALPLCKGGVCRGDAFRVAFLSGLAEPVGALLASLFLVSFQNLIPGALAFAGGVMVFITLDELIPTAREYGHEHYTAVGIILGSLFVFTLSGIFGV